MSMIKHPILRKVATIICWIDLVFAGLFILQAPIIRPWLVIILLTIVVGIADMFNPPRSKFVIIVTILTFIPLIVVGIILGFLAVLLAGGGAGLF